jgi:hypothetical protein
MKGARKLMKTLVSEGEVSMLKVPRAGWEMKIGAALASFTKKRYVGTPNGLQIRVVGEKSPRPQKSVHLRHEQQIKWEIPI